MAPTEAQRDLLASFAGASRFVWNWALDERQRHYREVILPGRAGGEKIPDLTSIDLTKRWTVARAEVATWYLGTVPALVATTAIQDLCLAFSRFFTGDARYPRFKVKGRSKERFRVSGDATEPVKNEAEEKIGMRVKAPYKATPTHIAIPRLGLVRVKEDPTARIGGARVTSVTVSCVAGRWYASIAVEHDVPEVIEYLVDTGRVLGIDVGIKTFAVLSDGSTVESPRSLERGLAAIRRDNRSCARKRNVRDGVATQRMQKRDAHNAAQRGERYWPDKAERKAQKTLERKARQAAAAADLAEMQIKARSAVGTVPARLPKEARPVEQKSSRLVLAEAALARAHRRAADRRLNFLHETSTRLVRRAARSGMTLSIEDLRVKNLMNGGFHLGRAFSDLGLGEFRRQITYKAAWAGVPLHVVDRFYASSKTCSRCGEVKPGLALSDRIFRCGRCGLVIDRDLNAARNIRQHAILAVMATARGEPIRPGDAGQDSQASGKRKSRNLAPRRSAAAAAA